MEIEPTDEAKPADCEVDKPSLFEGSRQANSPSMGDKKSPEIPQEPSNVTVIDESPRNPLDRRLSAVSDDYLQFIARPHHIEKRFPVDRKKLEQLITGGGRDNETADEFFKRIQEATDTLVLWPSRLKIGAKSKKDPQVKVVGLPANIQQARELILVDLDAKSTRVTLKIDVAFSEHSHVIGKEGANIKKVHGDTQCHIHFPDSNRFGGDRSSQVSITGQAASVEIARKRIRELLPVVVTFGLPLLGQVDSTSSDIQHMMLQYNVAIHLKPQLRQSILCVVVRGTVQHFEGVKLAVSSVVEYFTGDIHLVPVVSVNLDIAPQHHRTLIGSGGGNIKKIMAETSTSIQFPDPQSRFGANQVVVTGSIDSIFLAREQLLGCLPAVLMFDVHESDENVLSSHLIGELMNQLDLFISVKPKKGQLQSIIIKSIEQNILCMYQARTQILEYSYQPVSSSHPTLSSAPHSTLPSTPHVPYQSQPLSTSPQPMNTSPQPGHTPLKETPSKVTFSEETTLINKFSPVDVPDGVVVTSPSEHQVSFENELSNDLGGPEERTNIFTTQGQQLPSDKSSRENMSSPPNEMRPRSSSSSMGRLSNTPPVRPTTRQFLDYEWKKEQAQIARNSKVEPNKMRYPTTTYAGNYFSESMPAGTPHDPLVTPSSTSNTPQGLSSINRTSYQALMNQASKERTQHLQSEQDTYRDVTDLSTLLQRLNLEHYESCFQQEEVDLDTFLTMSEADLKEVGITTLGARRKLQIAISELKKVQGKLPTASLPRSSASLGRNVLNHHSTMGSVSLSPQRGLGGINRSASLTREPKFSGMSRSGRF